LRKLLLTRETLSILTDDQLLLAHGGDIQIGDDPGLAKTVPPTHTCVMCPASQGIECPKS